ncbi:hypothetical protein HN681_01555 [archaeon]|jgi:hypothetical protein|nr:hypothetical protein [archaeon]MBT3731260.1 hypothetical protein [archaeon]MBT4669986.1 hypothetical protein [archaeon]MBT5287812.1 hypothetical protein [archaeon]MBT7053254.1 hypothetical protein [archaeon]
MFNPQIKQRLDGKTKSVVSFAVLLLAGAFFIGNTNFGNSLTGAAVTDVNGFSFLPLIAFGVGLLVLVLGFFLVWKYKKK